MPITCLLWRNASDHQVCSSVGICSQPNQCTCETGYTGEEYQFVLIDQHLIQQFVKEMVFVCILHVKFEYFLEKFK
jgi:hypothetical protein